MADSENLSKDPVSTNTSGIKIGSFSDTELLILSEVEGSDEETNEVFLKPSVDCDVEMKDESTVNQNNMNAITLVDKKVEDEQIKDATVTVSPKASSEGDDFDLDDVIEEFAKEESKIAKLDDELDLLVDEFVEAEFSNPKTEEMQIKVVLSDSDDDMVILEDFKAENSDDECLIVEDSRNEIFIKDEEPPKPKLSKIEKYNSAKVQTKELQSVDKQINASSSNLVDTSLSDDIQEIPVTNSNSIKNCTVLCNVDLLTNPETVVNLKTSEPKPLDPVNSCESQMTCIVIDNDYSANAVSKQLTETVDIVKQMSVDMESVKNGNSNSCRMEIPFADQSSDLKSSETKPLDTVISCDRQISSQALNKNENFYHNANSEQISETRDVDKQASVYMTGVENGKADSCDGIEIPLGIALSIDAKPESHSTLCTDNSGELNCDLSSTEATLVVNENLNLKVDSDKNISKDNENFHLVAKAVLDYLLNKLSTTSPDEDTLSNKTNVSTLGVSIAEDVAVNEICMSNTDSSLSSVCHNLVEKCFQKKNEGDVKLFEGHSSLKNDTDGINPISVAEDVAVSKTCASNFDSSPNSMCHNVEKCSKEKSESGIKFFEGNSSRNDQNAINSVSVVEDGVNKTCISNFDLSPSFELHNLAEKCSQEKSETVTLESKSSLRNDQNAILSVVEDIEVNETCISNSVSSLSSLCQNSVENCSREKSDIENLENKNSSVNDQNGINLVSILEIVAVNEACTSNSDLSPSSLDHNVVAKCSEVKSEIDTENFEGHSSAKRDQDGTNLISVPEVVAVNKTSASNSDSSNSSECHNVVAKCSHVESESGIENLKASSYDEEEGGQDEIIIDTILTAKESHNVSKSTSEQVQLPTLSDESETPKDSKKRKINEVDENSETVIKKIKDKNLNEMELAGINSIVDKKVMEGVLEQISEADSMIVMSKKHLGIITRHICCCQSAQNLFTKDCTKERDVIKDFEEKVQVLDEDLLFFKTKASELVSAQQEAFQQNKYNPQVQIRTVGVNVKIFRECDLPPDPTPQVPPTECDPKTSLQQPVQVPRTSSQLQVPLTNPEKPKPPMTIPKETILTKAPPPVSFKPRPMTYSKEQIQQVQYVQQSAAPQRMSGPRLMTRTNLPTPRYFPVSPNVTMTGNPLAVAAPGMSRSLAPRLGTVAPNVKTSSGVIDLTDDESTAANKKLLSANANVSIPTTVSKVNLPAVSGNQQNVLVPISSFLQMLPSAQGQTIRQALVPSLPSGLGKKTVAYTCIVPSNSMAARAPVSSVMSSSNRLQTFFVQVPNTGSAPLNNIVNSSQRLLGPPSLQNASTPQSSTAPSSSASPLLLIPRAPAHPAPFPPTPNYPPNSKLKAIPPKPSLKGSKSPNGIILSWNMCIFSSHAQINNYQLFAYQETVGPVTSSLWKKVGDVNALPLPMACTLTQFVEGHRYYFTVRAVDAYSRIGPFSDAVNILYTKDKTPNSK